MPVSPEVALASEWDLFLPESILGYPAIAQTWNHGLVLPEQSSEQITILPAEQLAAVHALIRAGNASARPPEGLERRAAGLERAGPAAAFPGR